jgi:hypothetical protein
LRSYGYWRGRSIYLERERGSLYDSDPDELISCEEKGGAVTARDAR